MAGGAGGICRGFRKHAALWPFEAPDEKYVTEHAYENPRFVEDAVREVALRLEADKRITWYRAEVESMESIHNHNAFAVVEKGENECY